MPTALTLKEAIARRDAARRKYPDAAHAFRAAAAELGAMDRLCAARGVDGSPGFGNLPDATALRHAIALPDESGSIGDDIQHIIETTHIEG